MATNINDIEAYDWQVQLHDANSIVEGVDSIKQSIYLILSTPVGAIPHRPDFGCNAWKYIDYPTSSAIPNIITEAIRSVRNYEKRVDLTNIIANLEGGHITFNLTFKIKDSDIEESIEVTV